MTVGPVTTIKAPNRMANSQLKLNNHLETIDDDPGNQGTIGNEVEHRRPDQPNFLEVKG